MPIIEPILIRLLLSAVSPYVRRSEQVDVSIDYSRRYRTSRFRALPELWSVFRASKEVRSGSDDESEAGAGSTKRAVGDG